LWHGRQAGRSRAVTGQGVFSSTPQSGSIRIRWVDDQLERAAVA
jgi:hypothetical protein